MCDFYTMAYFSLGTNLKLYNHKIQSSLHNHKKCLIYAFMKSKESWKQTAGRQSLKRGVSPEFLVPLHPDVYSATTEVPGCGYGHYVFPWDRERRAEEFAEEGRAERHKVRKAQMTNDPSGG